MFLGLSALSAQNSSQQTACQKHQQTSGAEARVFVGTPAARLEAVPFPDHL